MIGFNTNHVPDKSVDEAIDRYLAANAQYVRTLEEASVAFAEMAAEAEAKLAAMEERS